MSGPGVASKILKPQEAVEIVRKALELCPEIKWPVLLDLATR